MNVMGRVVQSRRLLVVLPTGMMLACGEAPPSTGGPVALVWQVDEVPVLTLGEVDGPPSQLFSGITDVDLLGDGGVVIGDAASGTLRIFGPTGDFEGEMGGEGQGPGEFSYLASVDAVRGDTLLAYDPAVYRLTTFDRSGRVLSTAQMEPGGGAPEFYLGRDLEGHHIVALIRPAPRDPARVTPDAMEVRRYTADGKSWVSLGDFVGMRRVGSPVPFSPHFAGVVLDGTVFVSDGLLPLLTAIEDTAHVSVDVDAGGDSWTFGEAWSRLVDSVDDAGLRERLAATRDGPGWDSIPRYADMLADPSGSLWLKDYDPATDSHWVLRRLNGGTWTVVGTDGRRIASVTVPDDFRLMAVGHDRIAGVSRDALGVERVRVYRLSRSGTPAA